ncbi:hypothetical protein BpHYR1_038661 [Brachionus plicatilis]|uniref:Uncharacterized protein n=1 Tax=Brachionus plicatilis TaxID=10195 RepID=A0A3M7RC15_BRAPC|nr:hypothetical protein BpHYR1_038661 [Brachionus plicatilis]
MRCSTILLENLSFSHKWFSSIFFRQSIHTSIHTITERGNFDLPHVILQKLVGFYFFSEIDKILSALIHGLPLGVLFINKKTLFNNLQAIRSKNRKKGRLLIKNV